VKRAAQRPLLDDPFFLAELERLDVGLPLEEEWGGVHWQREPPISEASDDGRGPRDDAGELWDSERPGKTVAMATRSSRATRAGRMLLAIGGFVAMMLVGAAAAVVVFHDRVALILQTLR
jgi:hypothetical protein